MASSNHRGYAWAVAAGLNAALAAVSAKLFSSQFLKYGLVLAFSAMMWGCYVNSLKALSSLQATVTNFAVNFLTSGLAGYFFVSGGLTNSGSLSCNMKQPILLPIGAILIILGVFILSKSSNERKSSTD